MGKTAPLPLQSRSIAELQGNAKLGDVSKFKIKTLCESSGKIFKEALVQKDLGDEEKAYMLFFKYVDCVQKIRKNPEFKKDERYYTSMYNIQKNSKKAIDDLEVLAASLERRYEEKASAASSGGEKADRVAGKESRINAGKLLDVNSNEDSPAPLVNGVKEHQAEDIITYQRLFSLINEKSTTFFVLDTRPAEDYRQSHINLPQSLNVPETILKPGSTASMIGRGLSIEHRCQWDKRTSTDLLIICDWTSSSWEPGKGVTVLRDALTRWDPGSTLRHAPLLLVGGYQKFLFAYPQMVTDPKARAPASPRLLTKPTAPVLDINYPDLDTPIMDAGFLVTPSPSPGTQPGLASNPAALQSGAIRNAQPLREGGVRYPSLEPEMTSTPRAAPRPAPTPGFDRSTKPGADASSISLAAGSSASSLAGRDPLNEARQSFELEQSDSNSSLGSLRSSYGSLNTAVVEAARPRVDRASKASAVVKYGSQERELDEVSDVQQVELEMADSSLEREKERLDLENKWEFLRIKREAEHESTMRKDIQQEQEKLISKMEKLSLENARKEESEKKLMEALVKLKKQLKEKEESERKLLRNEEMRVAEQARQLEERKQEQKLSRLSEERARMRESVEAKRRERKLKEEKEEQEAAAFRDRSHNVVPSVSTKYRNKGVAPPPLDLGQAEGGGGGGLKRSFSSPNIAKMVDEEGGSGYAGVPVPKFDRKSKPSLISCRNFAGKWGTGKPGLTGLKNLGNTCYMNSILQCVSNTPPLAHYFVSRNFEEDLNEKHSETRGLIAREFAEVLKNLWSSQYKSISPGDLKQRVGRYKSEFAGRDQQDSHEFGSKLLEWLHDDTNKVARPSAMPEQDNTDSADVSAAKRHWQNYLERNQSIIVQLFCGQTRSIVRCFSCGGESVTYREFTNLTLPLPEHSSRITLRDCIEDYLKEEKIEEFKCDRCKKSGRVSKKTDIVRLPPLLIIHLSRFYQDGLYTRKKQNFVQFDLRNLDMGRYAVKGFDNQHTNYNMYAVSNHFGSLEGGHYTAYCSSSVLKKWFKFDDQDVLAMDPGDVVTPAAYILFFSAIEGLTSLPPLG